MFAVVVLLFDKKDARERILQTKFPIVCLSILLQNVLREGIKRVKLSALAQHKDGLLEEDYWLIVYSLILFVVCL